MARFWKYIPYLLGIEEYAVWEELETALLMEYYHRLNWKGKNKALTTFMI
ncbi:MAG: hypothetical protein ACLUOI_34355 [Eisenbergiella sp.]